MPKIVPDPLSDRLFTRRRLLTVGAGGLGALTLAPWLHAAHHEPAAEAAGVALPDATLEALRTSSLVYVSPLRSDGQHSKCQGEVWYQWDGDGVLLVTASDRWKAEAVKKGLTRTRIWVGDYGRIRRARSKLPTAPRFDAEARFDRDPAVFQALLEVFARKYPKEWDKWKPRFIKGMADGSRVLIRYTPIAG